MNIKEKVTALICGDTPFAVRTKREEKEPISDERFRLTLQCILRVATVAGMSATLVNIGIAKLIAILVFSVICIIFKD